VAAAEVTGRIPAGGPMWSQGSRSAPALDVRSGPNKRHRKLDLIRKRPATEAPLMRRLFALLQFLDGFRNPLLCARIESLI
jgi:hypothetical protein